MSYQPMEPMDSKLCVLLQLNLISSPGTYTQTQICDTISQNQAAFDSIYYDPIQRQAAIDANMDAVKRLTMVDKQEECG